MRFTPTRTTRANVNRSRAAFTLAEVLAALLFMAIVIPAAIEGLRVASLAGQVGQRKATAARIAERVLNELRVTGQLSSAYATGAIQEGLQSYQWTMRTQNWPVDTLRQVTVRVTFPVQGRDYEVQLSTLVDSPAS
jgi:type II secretory pathway pseudopilin PulG